MVGHEAIRENIDLVFFGIVLQPSEIGETIIIAKEYVLAAITPLGNVEARGRRQFGRAGACGEFNMGDRGDKG
jgi:hypothetical protein